MDDKTRETLKGELDELDRAEAVIIEARKPFDAALSAVDTIRTNLMEKHEVEIAGKCEGCAKLLFTGDKGFRCDDGPVLCAGCSPTFGNAEENWKAQPDDEDPERKKAFMDWLASHLAGGGSRDDKLPVSEL